MPQRRVGLWLIGAVGGVCSTAALGRGIGRVRVSGTTCTIGCGNPEVIGRRGAQACIQIAGDVRTDRGDPGEI